MAVKFLHCKIPEGNNWPVPVAGMDGAGGGGGGGGGGRGCG